MQNPIMERLKAGKACVNAWLMIDNGYVAEVMAQMGWDSLTIDLQHGLQDYGSLVRIMQAIHGHPVSSLARVPWNEPGIIGKVLDAGAWGIICPMVNTAEQARALVDACLYTPMGCRSYGPIRAGFYGSKTIYQETANENVLVLPQIETVEAVENVEAILDVPGISGVYVGPGDLGLSLGLSPMLDREEPEVLRIYEKILAATSERGKFAGIQNATPAYAARMGRMGFQILTVSSDITLMGQAAQQAIADTRAGAGEVAAV